MTETREETQRNEMVFMKNGRAEHRLSFYVLVGLVRMPFFSEFVSRHSTLFDIACLNPSSPDIKMHILLTVLHTFLMELVRRICLNIKTS